VAAAANAVAASAASVASAATKRTRFFTNRLFLAGSFWLPAFFVPAGAKSACPLLAVGSPRAVSRLDRNRPVPYGGRLAEAVPWLEVAARRPRQDRRSRLLPEVSAGVSRRGGGGAPDGLIGCGVEFGG
jgi:hypothetical protein